MQNNYTDKQLEEYRQLLEGEKEVSILDHSAEDQLVAFHILLGKALEAEDYKEAHRLVKKANGIVLEEEKTLTEKMKEWVKISEGDFHVSFIDRELGIISEKDKNNRRQVMHQLKTEEIIEKVRGKEGWYRRIIRAIEPMDYKGAPTTPLNIQWPLMEDEPMFNIYSGNIAVIAGNFNAGKSAYCLAFIRLNMDKYKIDYYSSEMGSSELRLRLEQFENIELHEWDFDAFERSDFFQDIIDKDKINIIDFLEISDAFYKIGGILTKIHDKLRGGKGIAVVALQKPPGRLLGHGGGFSAEKPRVYLSIDSGVLTIVKAKNWHGTENPNNMKCNFRLYRGAKFERKGLWYRDMK